MDEAGDIGSSMEQRGILLGQDVAELRVCVLWACKRRVHACVWRVEEADLLAGGRVDQGREEGGVGVGEVKGEMLDMVAYAGQRSQAALLGECAGCEGDGDACEEGLGEQVAAG